MIEYSKTDILASPRSFMYFAGDGSWGSADNIVVIDDTELDGHYAEFIPEVSDPYLPDFMRWYVNNQTHDQDSNDYTACRVCELWDSGINEYQIIESLSYEE